MAKTDDGAAHGEQRGLQDVHAVDLGDACNADGGIGAGQDRRLQRSAAFWFEQLRVCDHGPDRLRRVARGEDHRRGNHRPRPGAAAGLVDTDHESARRVLQRKVGSIPLPAPPCHGLF